MARTFGAGIAVGLAVSAGAALLRPLWGPAVARWGRPLTKGAVKGGLAAYALARERVAELGEKAEDLIAEAQRERAAEREREAPDI